MENNPQKLYVLLIGDDSPFFEAAAKALKEDSSLEVIGVAKNQFEATEQILKGRPGVVVCDVEMESGGGLEFLRRLLSKFFVPVVVVGALGETVFEALEAGAVDFAAKPVNPKLNASSAFFAELIKKIKTAALVNSKPQSQVDREVKLQSGLPKDPQRVIVIGASTGGTEAIFSVLSALPNSAPGIAIVQHIPPVFSKMFAQRLNSQTTFAVKEAETGDFLKQGSVLLAPGDRHIRLKKVGGKYKVECFNGEKVNGHCPSVDVLFESAANEAGSNAIGVLLTGMGNDGAKGLLSIRKNDGQTIGQNRETSVVYGMPKAAFDIGAVMVQAALCDIPQELVKLLKQQEQ